MRKIKSTLPNILLSLTITCVVAGAALSATNNFTEKAVVAAMEAELQNAIKKVLPEFDNDPVKEQYKMAITEGDSLTIYPAINAGQNVGYAIESYSKKGFSGLIRIMVGFNTDGKIHHYSVLEHSETPGLGSKMGEWFSTDKNRQSIIGRDMTRGALKLTKDGGDVDAITASTISSRAFLEAINLAYSVHSGNSDATSGATGVDTTDETDGESGATSADTVDGISEATNADTTDVTSETTDVN